MASEKRIQCWFSFLVFLCFIGFTEAIRKAPCAPLLPESRPENPSATGISMQGVGVAESETVVTKQAAEIEEEGRILLEDGNGVMSSTMDYSGPSANHDHDPKGHRGNGN